METKKIVIVKDHQLFREGLMAMLASFPGIEVAGEADDGTTGLALLKQASADLLLLDLSMPRLNGVSVIREAKRLYPELRILVLTLYESDKYVLEAFDAGANGYCIKDVSRDEMFMAIETVLKGRIYISPGIADSVMEGYIEGRRRLKEKSRWENVTRREREVLKLLGEGYLNREIADLLHISRKTVEKHRTNIMSKLDLHNAAALAAFAIHQGLVEKKG